MLGTANTRQHYGRGHLVSYRSIRGVGKYRFIANSFSRRYDMFECLLSPGCTQSTRRPVARSPPSLEPRSSVSSITERWTDGNIRLGRPPRHRSRM